MNTINARVQDTYEQKSMIKIEKDLQKNMKRIMINTFHIIMRAIDVQAWPVRELMIENLEKMAGK